MKTFIADIIPKIQRFSQRLNDLTKLTNQHWVSLGDIDQTKRVFIFRANNQLLISDNGIVEKGSWEYLGNQSLLLDTKDESYLLKHGFFDENVIALKLDSTESYAFFVNEIKYHGELNNITDVLKFLEKKYLKINGTPNESDSLQKTEPEILHFNKLSKPNLFIKRFLNYEDEQLVNLLRNWESNCSKLSTDFPMYVFAELRKRGIQIPKDILADLEFYAHWKKFNSFADIIKYYFE
jgi:hypothetical protein